MSGYKAGLDGGQVDDMHNLWKLYNREEIVDKLNVLCPGHGFTKESLKIPMLILWLQNEDVCDDPDFMRKVRFYGYVRMDRCPPKKKDRPKRRKRRRRKRGRTT